MYITIITLVGEVALAKRVALKVLALLNPVPSTQPTSFNPTTGSGNAANAHTPEAPAEHFDSNVVSCSSLEMDDYLNKL